MVKYTESYSSDEGVGTFTIHIKPLYGQEIEVLCEAPSATYNANSTPLPELEEETKNKIIVEQKQNTVDLMTTKSITSNSDSKMVCAPFTEYGTILSKDEAAEDESLRNVHRIIKKILEEGPEWKSQEALERHLKKRIQRDQVPSNWTVIDYNNKIIEVCSNPDSCIYEYYQEEFDQKYYIFGDWDWIVMVGENGIMETTFPPDTMTYSDYLNEHLKVEFIGKIGDVYK